MYLSFIASLTAHVAARAAGPPSASDGLDEVMRLLGSRRHGEANFIEQRFLSLLKKPAESSGVLIYDAPNHLEKRTLEPRPESLLVDGNAVTVQRGHRTRVFELSSYPQVLPFVESIRATLAGDRAALAKVFRLDFTGSAQRWTLTLTPLDARVAQSVSQVRIDGARAALLNVEIRQPDGDRSLMTLRARADP